MIRSLAGAVLLLLVAAAPARAAAPFDDAGYWAFADRMEQRLDPLWNPAAGVYNPGGASTDTIFNANMLIVHSVAAQQGHAGPARADARARAILRALVASPPFVTAPPASGALAHAPGWISSLDASDPFQHLVVDAEVVDALAHAWAARRALRLDDATAALIAARIHAVATSAFWRWPTLRLNQINWYAEIYAADALVTGSPALLTVDLRRQIARFAANSHGNAHRAGNLGPGLRFHYMPTKPRAQPSNVDSAEYGSIVASFTRFYTQARVAGMAPPSRATLRVLRRWLVRVVAGYWTHAGYLNWDSGLGFRRWHEIKKLGLAQQGLLGIASAPSLPADPSYAAYAKWLLDRGFDFYDRVAGSGIAPSVLFGLTVATEGAPQARVGAARMAANAARAVAAGLGHAPALQPPALYAFDPDTGRLAVTTPRYNTAIVPVSQGAFPYGGIELARLYDADQDVAANIGGQAPDSFGLLVRDGSGRAVLQTQLPHRHYDRHVRPLRLTRAPAGVGARPSAPPRASYAGPFSDLRAVGSRRTRTLRASTRHRFTPSFVETTWRLIRRRGHAPLQADVLFPSWGARATVSALLRDGSIVPVAGPLALERVRAFRIRSAAAGYTLVVRQAPRGATARLVATAPQPSDPQPGPTLAISIARGTRFAHASLTARLTPEP